MLTVSYTSVCSRFKLFDLIESADRRAHIHVQTLVLGREMANIIKTCLKRFCRNNLSVETVSASNNVAVDLID